MASLLGANYDSSGDEDERSKLPAFTSATKIVAAPEVNVEVWFLHHAQNSLNASCLTTSHRIHLGFN
jgi:hypothetical protein